MRRAIALLWLVVASQAWAAFGYYSPITIQAGQVPGTETDFPILISVTDARLKTVANGGHVQDAQGDDIRPYTDGPPTTAITGYEKVFYDGTNGILEMWVKRASVADGLVTYLAYGDAGLTTDGSSTTTWSNSFLGVYHLGDGTTLNVNSSTGTRNGTNTNSATATTGQIDGAGSFASASTQYVAIGAQTPTAAVTLSAWMKGTTFPGAYNWIVGSQNASPNVYQIIHVKSNGKLAMEVFATNDRSYDGTGSHTLSTGTWYYLTMTYNSSAGLVGYVNAASDQTVAANGAAQTANTQFTQIAYNVAFSSQPFNGAIDEARWASVARSANWITTEYNNQVAPGTFMVLGTEVPIATPTNTGAFLQFYP